VISFRQFNKSKKNSVLLIHGLFSSSGFWLEYLQYFKDLRVVLCDIDYDEFFDNPKYFYKIISDHIHANHINKTIAHSFGSSINLSIPNDIMKINICPTHFKSRTNKTNFIDDIYLKTKLDKEKINKLLIKADKFYKKIKSFLKKINPIQQILYQLMIAFSHIMIILTSLAIILILTMQLKKF